MLCQKRTQPLLPLEDLGAKNEPKQSPKLPVIMEDSEAGRKARKVMSAPRRMTPEQRFWLYTRKGNPDECWKWLGYIPRGKYGLGYGQLRDETKKRLPAHRFSYRLHKGPIPNGLIVCHKCDNPKCVNPNHLFLGTHKDNAEDRDRKGRGNPGVSLGEKHGNSVITDKIVLEMRRLYRPRKVSQQFLADRFNCDRKTVSHVVRRSTWRHI